MATIKGMQIEMSLIAKGIKVKKVCKSEKECFIFERDMPSKYNLLFSKTPYVIGKRKI
jgi:hypothetical protein